MFKIMLGVLIATLIAITLFVVIDPTTTNGVTTSQSQSEQSYFSVTVSGQVVRPGTYVMDEGNRLFDLIETAGGLTNNADDRCYDLNLTLIGSMNYYIAPIYDESDICGNSPYAKVGLNSGSKQDLMTVNGIGDTIATAIITYRGSHDLFTYLEEIKKVSGIGNATFEKIKNNLTLQ